MDHAAPYTTRRNPATMPRPATSYLTALNQRLRQRAGARASATRRRPARQPRPHQPFTAPPSPLPAIWNIEAAELTHVLKDSWH